MKHISPKQVFLSMLTFSLFTCIYAAQALSFTRPAASIWSFILLGFGLVCLLLQLILARKIHQASKTIQADEYTTALLHKSAYHTLMLLAALICLLFILLGLLIILHRSATSLGEIIDLQLVLGLVAFIQLFSLTSFALFYFFLARRDK